jgi:hypothetical protein
MGQGKFFDKLGFVIASATLLASLYIFYTTTGEFTGSFVAALMTACLIWATYIIIKWLFLANRS